MSEAENAQEKRGFTVKMLDGIERVGNKVPHPAIIFAGLCVFVIVLSAILNLLDVSITYDVAQLPPDAAGETELGGSTAPEVIIPPEYGDPEPEITTQTTAIESLLSVDGLRFIFTSFVSNFAGFGVVAVTFIALMGAGVAEGTGSALPIAGDGAVIDGVVAIGAAAGCAGSAGPCRLAARGAACGTGAAGCGVEASGAPVESKEPALTGGPPTPYGLR